MIPRVSVIIPVYNLRDYLADAIESVLAQTLPADQIEVLVVDDGSTDDSAAVAARYGPRVRCERQENRGLSAARNAGVRFTCAPLVTFLDADDRLLPAKLAAQLALLDTRPDIGAAYTGHRCIGRTGELLPQSVRPHLEGDLLHALVLANLAPPHAPVVRRESIARIGGFDETLTSAEDWDLWLRLARAGLRWACVAEPLAEYRVRSDGMHGNPPRMAANRVRVLDKLFVDPTLAPDVVAHRPLAYQHAHLLSAAEHYWAGNRSGGARWFRAGVAVRPALLTEPHTLRAFCLLLLPVGYQTGTVMAGEWRRLAVLLRAALRDVFSSPDLDPAVAGLRWRAEVAAWRALLPVVRKRVRALLSTGSHRARLVRQRRALRAFEHAGAYST